MKYLFFLIKCLFFLGTLGWFIAFIQFCNGTELSNFYVGYALFFTSVSTLFLGIYISRE